MLCRCCRLRDKNQRLSGEKERLYKENEKLWFAASALENDSVPPPTYESVEVNSTASEYVRVHDEIPEGGNAGHESNDVDSANDALTTQLQALTLASTSAKVEAERKALEAAKEKAMQEALQEAAAKKEKRQEAQRKIDEVHHFKCKSDHNGRIYCIGESVLDDWCGNRDVDGRF